MNRFLKFALGVTILGIVGLVGLGVLGIFIAVPMATYTHEINDVVVQEIPARAVPIDGTEADVNDTFSAPAIVQHTVRPNWSAPAQIHVNARTSWLDIAGTFAGALLFVGMFAILIFAVRAMRSGRANNVSNESALVHELARRAQEMSQRMEALETILLDRTRATR